MTELSWLCDLLVNHKLSSSLKKHVAERITEVESSRAQVLQVSGYVPAQKVIHGAVQSPSTVALMEKHSLDQGVADPTTPIATTPQTQAAIAQRQQAIASGMNGKPQPGQTSPRKW